MVSVTSVLRGGPRKPGWYRRAAFALLIGLASGTLAASTGVPLPWMLGPMIGNSIAALANLPISGPDRLRPFVIPVIGVMLGSGITPDIFGTVSQWGVTLLVLPFFLLVAAASSYQFYRRVGRYDPVTAFFSAMPGGLNEMLLLGAEAGGDQRRIALAHASRILIVIFFVVMFFGLFLGVSSTGSSRPVTEIDALRVSDFGWLIGCAVLGVPLGRLLRLPAAPITGPMLLSGIAHVAGLVQVPPPTVIIIGAQIVIGTIIGCRFVGATAREIGRDLALGTGSSISMIAVAVAFAAVVQMLTDFDLAQAFLAYSPGGLTEMSLLALAMGQDIAYVSITHIVRITLVILTAPMVFRAIRRRPGTEDRE